MSPKNYYYDQYNSSSAGIKIMTNNIIPSILFVSEIKNTNIIAFPSINNLIRHNLNVE